MAAPSAHDTRRLKLGSRLGPPRFLTFFGLFLVGTPFAIQWLGWRLGTMAAFDGAAIVFLLLLIPLLNDSTEEIRTSAKHNDANRLLLLAVTSLVSLVILVSVAAELGQKGAPKLAQVALVIATLSLSWLVSNIVYALHYAHVFYDEGEGGSDSGGLEFPKTDEPDYSDFLYFSFCLGMTFQVSDVDITSRRLRRIVTIHCMAAFVFNLGVIAFSINVLGG